MYFVSIFTSTLSTASRHGRIFAWIYNIYRVKLIFNQRLKVVIKCDGYKFMLFASRHYLFSKCTISDIVGVDLSHTGETFVYMVFIT